MASKPTNSSEPKELATKPAIDIDFLNIPIPEDFVNLDELTEPLKEIKDFLGQPVVVFSASAKKPSTKGDGGFYHILEIQHIVTGEQWKSSCSHWFMLNYIAKTEELGKPAFPVAITFYKDGDSIKFKGVDKKRLQF